MTNKKHSADAPRRAGDTSQADALEQGNTVKDPDEWTTGDEPMTGPQASYLQTLAREAGEEVPEGLSKAEASRLIDELRERTGRSE